MNENKIKKEECKWGRFLGGGAFGKVYEIEYRGKKYAGKKIPKSKLKSEKFKESFKRELDILKRMSICENSVKFYSHFEEAQYEIIILELCDGNLTDILDKYEDGFNSDLIYSIIDGLNNAFKCMNQNNIIHRDIKLDNIMVKYTDSSHNKFIPKINDYGLSRLLEEGIASTWCGSPIYMAPEVLLNNKYGIKADLWSIGIMIYYMHFKEYPFDFTRDCINNEKVLKQVLDRKKKKNSNDLTLDDLMNKLLIYNPNNRITWTEYLNHPFFNRKPNKLNDNSPFYLKMNKGINLFGLCHNPKCELYKKQVCYNLGFGTFDLIKDLDSDNPGCPKCPLCKYCLLSIDNCKFMFCNYSFKGKKYENNQILNVDYKNKVTNENKIDNFLAGQKGNYKTVWIDLKITASQL